MPPSAISTTPLPLRPPKDPTQTPFRGMKQWPLPNHEEWIAAALSEVHVLEKNETWVEVPLSDAETKILPGTWVFRHKRTPNGIVKKHKGRYCCRSDLEEGIFDMTAYVVFWSTVHLFLVLSLTWGWSTCSINFASAFVQAKLKNRSGSIHLAVFTQLCPARPASDF